MGDHKELFHVYSPPEGATPPDAPRAVLVDDEQPVTEFGPMVMAAQGIKLWGIHVNMASSEWRDLAEQGDEHALGMLLQTPLADLIISLTPDFAVVDKNLALYHGGMRLIEILHGRTEFPIAMWTGEPNTRETDAADFFWEKPMETTVMADCIKSALGVNNP